MKLSQYKINIIETIRGEKKRKVKDFSSEFTILFNADFLSKIQNLIEGKIG